MIPSCIGRCWQLGLMTSLAMGGVVVFSNNCAFAQIVRDPTLGVESSVVTPNVDINGTPSDQIDGGAIRGTNLFHSFQEFNVGEGRGAYFINPAGIENILSRVTGSNPSNILGKLGVLGGNANLFLINPNGIIFGSNASLDVRASFIATTANAVRLGETGLFSASEPATSNLLIVHPSALWFNAAAGRAIVNQSQAPSLIGQPNSIGGSVGLQVPSSQTLALVGGDVVLQGGKLTAAGGHIELGSVVGVGEVNLNQADHSWLFGYGSIDTFGNIQLNDNAFVDASGEGGGSFQLQAAQLEMKQGSRIFVDTLGARAGKDVFIRATDVITLNDGAQVTVDVSPTGTGTGGNLKIETGQLSVLDGSRIRTGTFNQGGKGGNLIVTASESVELLGTGTTPEGRPARSGLFTQSQGVGDAGTLTIGTKRLIAKDGAVVSTATLGEARGGDLIVDATDSVELSGSSRLFTNTTGTQGAKDAGNLRISTAKLSVKDGAVVSTATSGKGQGGSLTVDASDSVELIGKDSGLFTQAEDTGDAGNLRISTAKLSVKDGAIVSTATSGKGQGGSLTVDASDSVELIGEDSGLFTQAEDTGDAGELRISTKQLNILRGSEVTVSSEGLGDAGELVITARSMRLDNQGKITAETNSGQGGDINLQAQDLLQLRGNSEISTDARRGLGSGGNIRIDTDLLAAVENSNITARAIAGKGGNIRITTQGLFLSPDSQITATSEQGINGVVEINRPDIDPSAELVILPAQLVDVSGLIAQGCPAVGSNVASGESKFVVTGRGGLPPTSRETLNSDGVLEDWGKPALATAKLQISQKSDRLKTENRFPNHIVFNNATHPTPTLLVEAQGWVIGDNGEVVLTASASRVASHNPWLAPAACHGN